MKNRWKSAWKELRGNRGSGVLLVMVAISCITLMAVSLLHLSYTAFKIKAAERQGKIDFYMADSKEDELLAGIQKKVSEAIAEAQKITLIEYESPSATATVVTPTPEETEDETQEGTNQSDTNQENANQDTEGDSQTQTVETVEEDETPIDVEKVNTERFQEVFLDELEEWAQKSGETYDVSKLKALLSTESANAVTFTDDADCKYTKDTINKKFILQNVRLTYTSEKSGNVTSVKLDIVISVPDFLYVKAGSSAGNDAGEWNVEEMVTFENWSTY